MPPVAFPRRRLIALGAAWLGATGMTRVVEPTAAQKKLLAHATNDDPAWTILAQAAVSEDKERGVLTAAFPPGLKALEGKPFSISGFMAPMEAKTATRHFAVTRRDPTCPFCPPSAPNEAVEVITDRPVALTEAEVTVSGALLLLSDSRNGLFFGLKHADFALAHAPSNLSAR